MIAMFTREELEAFGSRELGWWPLVAVAAVILISALTAKLWMPK